MKRFILFLIILASVGLGGILGATYQEKKLADKFDLVTAQLNDVEFLTTEVCNVITRQR